VLGAQLPLLLLVLPFAAAPWLYVLAVALQAHLCFDAPAICFQLLASSSCSHSDGCRPTPSGQV
jgi:hypothetical protein